MIHRITLTKVSRVYSTRIEKMGKRSDEETVVEEGEIRWRIEDKYRRQVKRI